MFKPGDIVRRKEACLRDEYWLSAIRGRSRKLNKALSLNGTWVVDNQLVRGGLMSLVGLKGLPFGFRYFEHATPPLKI